jgi:transposase
LRGYRVHTLLCRGSGLPLLFLLSPAYAHDAPFACPLLSWAVRLYGIHPRLVRLDAGYWGLRLIAWIHTQLGAVAVILWNPKRQKNRSRLSPTWTADELGKRSAIERFFGRVFSLFSPLSPAAPAAGRKCPLNWGQNGGQTTTARFLQRCSRHKASSPLFTCAPRVDPRTMRNIASGARLGSIRGQRALIAPGTRV